MILFHMSFIFWMLLIFIYMWFSPQIITSYIIIIFLVWNDFVLSFIFSVSVGAMLGFTVQDSEISFWSQSFFGPLSTLDLSTLPKARVYYTLFF